MTQLFNLRKLCPSDKAEFLEMSPRLLLFRRGACSRSRQFSRAGVQRYYGRHSVRRMSVFYARNAGCGLCSACQNILARGGRRMRMGGRTVLKAGISRNGRGKNVFREIIRALSRGKIPPRSGTRQRTGKKAIPRVRFYFPSLRTNEKRLLILYVKRRSEHIASGAFYIQYDFIFVRIFSLTSFLYKFRFGYIGFLYFYNHIPHSGFRRIDLNRYIPL